MDEYLNADISMTLIAYSGEARTLAFEALQKARENDFDLAQQLLAQSKASSHLAHQAQTELLTKEANQETLVVNVLLAHAQDHLMTSMLAIELIEEMIYLHQNKEDKEKNK